MNSPSQAIKLSSHELEQPDDASPLVGPQGHTRRPGLLRSHTLLATLAILAALGLMLAFYQVLLGAVAQGESLQSARNQESATFWRCHLLRSATERDNCLFLMKAEVSASKP